MYSDVEIVQRALRRSGMLPHAPPDPLQWIQDNFYLYDTGDLMKLYDWQIRPLQAAFERDQDGRYRYNTVVWSWPKKSAKSSVIAAVVDYIAEHTPRASIKLIANDLKQADSRVGMYLRESIRHSQRRGQRPGIKITPSGYKIDYPNGARVEMIPIDPSGEAGGNDDLIVYSELWGWKHTAHQRMWSEMTLSPTKYGRAQRWIDTYAGFVGESPVLESLYETGIRHGRRIWDDLEVYENEAAKVLAVWVTRPLFPWQTPDYYQEQMSTLTPNEYARMHENQWVSSEDVFVPPAWWDACKGELPPLTEYSQMVVGLDAAVSSDCFGIIGVTKHEEKIAVRYVRKWTPPMGGKLSYAEPEAEIRQLAASGKVACFTYDEYQLHDLTNRLNNEGLGWFKKFPQGEDRLIADKRLYDAIREGRVIHDGNVELREHVLNANAKVDGNGDRLRLVKRAEHLKIDLAVALSMAAYCASRLNID